MTPQGLPRGILFATGETITKKTVSKVAQEKTEWNDKDTYEWQFREDDAHGG